MGEKPPNVSNTTSLTYIRFDLGSMIISDSFGSSATSNTYFSDRAFLMNLLAFFFTIALGNLLVMFDYITLFLLPMGSLETPSPMSVPYFM